MSRRNLRLLIAMLLVSACREEVLLPATPPHGFEWPNVTSRFVSTTRLQAQAGGDAEECGVARDRASADRVYDCAARALRTRRAFVCRYDWPPIPLPYWNVVPIGIGEDSPLAFAGTEEGVVIAMRLERDGNIVTLPMLSPADRNPEPKRLHAGMIPPQLLRSEPVDIGDIYVHRLVFVEATIDARGVVTQARLLTPDPDVVEKRARDAVADATFEPARFFGVPQPVAHGVIAYVDRGVITVRAE